MRRFVGAIGLGVVLGWASLARALDAGIDDAGIDDASTSDASTSDASTTKDASPIQDASGGCCPTLPCTCPADTGAAEQDQDAGSGTMGNGCSCDTPGASSTTAVSAWWLMAIAVILRRRRPAT